MKRLIVMRGAPGSGKSTEAKRIRSDAASQGLSVAIHSTDIYFMANGVYAFVPDRLPVNHARNQDAAHGSMIRGFNIVIIDNVNSTRSEFEPYVMMAERLGYAVEFREPSSPQWLAAREALTGDRNPDEIERLAGVLASKCSHGVPEYVIANILHRYQTIAETMIRPFSRS